jgi:uncharacterized protein YceH (UPF0502 family)
MPPPPPELTPPEQRVLGCLIEKRRTTPDTYPLSINALRLACNQSTNRDPVVAYDEHTVREAAQRLSRRGLARLASGAGSRAIKYRHLAEEGLGLGDAELAVLCVLLLRGAQTPGELKARTERLARIDSLADVEQLLDALTQRGYVSRLPRRPGHKEDRFQHMLRSDPVEVDTEEAGGGADPGVRTIVHRAPVAAARPPDDGRLEARVVALEEEVAALREELRDLREALGD